MNTQVLPAIVQEITIAAPAARIFRALTDPNEAPRWWGSDESFRCTSMTADLRVGGRWTMTGTNRDGSPFTTAGVYRVVDPPHHLECTWRHDWGEGREETIVRYDLIENDGSTLVRVTHTGFTSSDDHAGHDRGWAAVLGWLKAYSQR
jgi:uncharacterized protein YndB with AHSA1/START domain